MDPERRPDLRVGDAEREVTLERLRDGHAEGRLDADEFYGRLDAVYTARTFADLDALVADLPAAGVTRYPPPPPRRTVAPPRTDGRGLAAVATPATGGLLASMPPALRRIWLTWATAVMINVVVWTAVSLSSDEGLVYFWPVWVAGPWGVINLGLTANWWLGRGADQREIGPST